MKKIFLLLILLFANNFIFAQTAITSRNEISDLMNKRVISNIQESQAGIYDYDNDGKINCVDYSCLFKITWDKNFPNEKYRCELVRNVQENAMNHLFVRILDEKQNYIEVEPWSPNPNFYLMTENWPKETYNPKYNIYGETEFWLAEGEKQNYGQKRTAENSSKKIGAYFCLGYTSGFSVNKFGFELSSETAANQGEFFSIFSFDYLMNHSEEKNVDSWLLGFDLGYGVLTFFQPYLGGSLGMKWTDSFSLGNVEFAWKVNSGVRIPFSSFTVRADISYGTILGLAGTFAIGLYL